MNWQRLGPVLRRLSLATSIALLVMALLILGQTFAEAIRYGFSCCGRTDVVGLGALVLSVLFFLDYLLLRKEYKFVLVANSLLFGLAILYLIAETIVPIVGLFELV